MPLLTLECPWCTSRELDLVKRLEPGTKENNEPVVMECTSCTKEWETLVVSEYKVKSMEVKNADIS
jgi:hypothetical protein